MKMKPSQKRKAAATRLEKLLPAKPGRSGETVVKDSDLRRAINALRK